MHKKLFYILTLSLIITSLSAQNTSIKGTVLDNDNNKPIEYASIALLSSVNNSVINGAVSNKNGVYLIQNVKNGSYKLKVYFVGYEAFFFG